MPPEIDQSHGSMHKPQQHQPQQKITPKVVTKHGLRTVVPIRPSKLAIHPVSKLDSVLGNFYLHTVLYLESQKLSSKPRDDEEEELHFALAQALNLFPVLSGRLRVLADGSLGIKSNDSGIRLIEATCDSTLHDWLHDPDASSLRQQVIPEIRITDYSVSALCSVQLTRFRCGGYAFGISWCHILGDFMSMDLFIKLWAESYRNKGRMPSKVPCFSLEKNGHHLQEPEDHIDADVDSSEGIESGAQLESRVFHFSSKSIEKLTHEEAPGASELDAVCGLVWKSVVRAQSPSDRSESSRLCILIPNPQSDEQAYFGNAASKFKLVDASCGDLIDQSTEGISRWIQVGGSRVSKAPSSFFSKNVLFCNWAANVPCYETDFGGFSKLVYVDMCASSLFGEGIVTIAPGAQSGHSKSLCLSLERNAMKRLLQDNLFASAASANASPPSAEAAAEETAVAQKINCSTTISAAAA